MRSMRFNVIFDMIFGLHFEWIYSVYYTHNNKVGFYYTKPAVEKVKLPTRVDRFSTIGIIKIPTSGGKCPTLVRYSSFLTGILVKPSLSFLCVSTTILHIYIHYTI